MFKHYCVFKGRTVHGASDSICWSKYFECHSLHVGSDVILGLYFALMFLTLSRLCSYSSYFLFCLKVSFLCGLLSEFCLIFLLSFCSLFHLFNCDSGLKIFIFVSFWSTITNLHLKPSEAVSDWNTS